MKEKIVLSLLLFWKVHIYLATHLTCPRENGPEEAINFPHPRNCAKFVTCNWGTEVVRDCAPGTLWNDAVKTCDHPRNVKCGTRTTTSLTKPTKSYRTTPSIVTSTVVNLPTNGGCPNVVDANNPVFMPHLDCTRFYVCTLKGPVELRCNEGFHWSIKTNNCERPWEAWCVTNDVPPRANDDGCPSVIDPKNPTFLPHPDSNKIYMCIPGLGRTELSCPEGLHWSADGCISGTSTPGSAATTAMSPPSTSTASTDETLDADYFTTDSSNL